MSSEDALVLEPPKPEQFPVEADVDTIVHEKKNEVDPVPVDHDKIEQEMVEDGIEATAIDVNPDGQGDEQMPLIQGKVKLFPSQLNEIKEKGWFTVWKRPDGTFVNPDDVNPENEHIFEKEEWQMGWMMQVGKEKRDAVGPSARETGKNMFTKHIPDFVSGRPMEKTADGEEPVNVNMWHGGFRVLRHHFWDLPDKTVGMPHFRKIPKPVVAEEQPAEAEVEPMVEEVEKEKPEETFPKSDEIEPDADPQEEKDSPFKVTLPEPTAETTDASHHSEDEEDGKHDQEEEGIEPPLDIPQWVSSDEEPPLEIPQWVSSDEEPESEESEAEPYGKVADRRFRFNVPFGKKDGETRFKTFYVSTKYPGWRLKLAMARTLVTSAWFSKGIINKILLGWVGWKIPYKAVKSMIKYHKDLWGHLGDAKDETGDWAKKIHNDFKVYRDKPDEGMFPKRMATIFIAIRQYLIKGAVGIPLCYLVRIIADTFADHAKLCGMLLALIFGAHLGVFTTSLVIPLLGCAVGLGHACGVHCHLASMTIADLDTHHYKTQKGISFNPYNEGDDLFDNLGKVGNAMTKEDAVPVIRLTCYDIPIKGFGQFFLAPTCAVGAGVAGCACYSAPLLVVFPRAVYDKVAYSAIVKPFGSIPKIEQRGLVTHRIEEEA